MKTLLAVLMVGILTCTALCQQAGEYKTVNFDKLLVGTDKLIYISPPPGMRWSIMAGSISMEQVVAEASIIIWMQSYPFQPFRDPITGDMIGCYSCVDILRVPGQLTAFVPIVGGYTTTSLGTVLQGQASPIILTFPDRLMIAVTPPHGGLSMPVRTFTRLRVLETPAP